MNHQPTIIATLALLALAGTSVFAKGDDVIEIKLRATAVIPGSIVLLGDVADVTGADPTYRNKLNRLELFPTPVVARPLSASDLERLLNLYAVSRPQYRLTGAPQVVIQRDEGIVQSRVQTANRSTIGRVIRNHLQESSTRQASWDVQLDAKSVAAIPANYDSVTVEKASLIGNGKRSFELAFRTPDGPRRVTTRASVIRTEMVLKADRTIRRGERIALSDVVLVEKQVTGTLHGLQNLEDVVGFQATRTINAGQEIDARMVKPPVLIRRRDPVVVFARVNGIEVKVFAQAMSDGAKDELITVKPEGRRDTLTARVVASGVAEVLALGSTVSRRQ